MEFIKNLLGIGKLEKQISQNKTKILKLEKITKSELTENYKPKILQILKTPKSTTQVAKSLNISRSHTSKILNELEKLGKIYEHSKKGRVVFYKKG